MSPHPMTLTSILHYFLPTRKSGIVLLTFPSGALLPHPRASGSPRQNESCIRISLLGVQQSGLQPVNCYHCYNLTRCSLIWIFYNQPFVVHVFGILYMYCNVLMLYNLLTEQIVVTLLQLNSVFLDLNLLPSTICLHCLITDNVCTCSWDFIHVL